jgi:WD40 repeat protein
LALGLLLAFYCVASIVFGQPPKGEQVANPAVLTPEKALPPVPNYGRPYSLAFSPDGKTLAAGVSSKNNGVVLYDVMTGDLKHVLNKLASGPGLPRFTPSDGKFVLAGHYLTGPDIGEEFRQTVVVRWDTATGKQTGYYSFPGTVGSGVISPDARWVVTGVKDKVPAAVVKVWQIEPRQEIATLDAGEEFGRLKCSAFSPDGKLYAMGGGTQRERGKIAFWNCEKLKGKRVLTVKGGYLEKMSFSAKGRLLACSTNYLQGARPFAAVEIYDLEADKWLPFEIRPKGTSRIAQLSPDGKLVATGYLLDGDDGKRDYGIELWSTATGKSVAVLKGAKKLMEEAAFSPDGTLIAASNPNGELLIWRLPKFAKQDGK